MRGDMKDRNEKGHENPRHNPVNEGHYKKRREFSDGQI